jgi:hypothetical protein
VLQVPNVVVTGIVSKKRIPKIGRIVQDAEHGWLLLPATAKVALKQETATKTHRVKEGGVGG